MDQALQRVSKLRRQIQLISTPIEALTAASEAKKFEGAAKLVGESLKVCNEYSELYLEAVWVFGDLVKDIPAGRPKTVTDNGLNSGTEMQRKYARKFRKSVDREGIRPYIEKCNEEQVQASIVGCISCYDGGLNHRAQGSGENEWYTPIEYINAAHDVMGSIDLDPASSEIAQEKIQAGRYFSVENDGLVQKWHGNIWLNPPYSRDIIKKFIEKLLSEIFDGNVKQAVLLTHNYTDTGWFHLAEEAAQKICFTRGRIAFINGLGKVCQPTQGQAFFYFGKRHQRFSTVFSEIGFIR